MDGNVFFCQCRGEGGSQGINARPILFHPFVFGRNSRKQVKVQWGSAHFLHEAGDVTHGFSETVREPGSACKYAPQIEVGREFYFALPGDEARAHEGRGEDFPVASKDLGFE